jgi:endonuclease/exonuclease/phosphatase family metal-dependent hydrolase
MKVMFTKTACLFSGGPLLMSLLLQSCATSDLHSKPTVQSYQNPHSDVFGSDENSDPALTVLTLNIAHGRGDSFHQLLQRSDTTLANLGTIATLFKTTDPDVVALQEADGPSFWSGNFDHVEYLANQASFGHSVHGAHADGIGLSYGTALLANLELQNAQAITFDPALSPVPKGFVVSTIRWPDIPCVDIDVVSIHLDFASESVRRKQAMELIETVRARNRPLIIMGDLNSEWQLQDSSVQYLSQELALSAYSPERIDLDTFPALGERLDWILVSPELKFRSYHVLADVVSDHRGVVAELVLDKATRASADQGSCSVAKAAP